MISHLKFFFLLALIPVLSLSGDMYANSDLTSPGFTINLGQLDPVNGGNPVNTGKQALLDLLTKISDLLLFATLPIAGISFIFAGYYYILSAGDSEKASKAKTIIKWNLIGITIAISSYAIITLIATILGGGIR